VARREMGDEIVRALSDALKLELPEGLIEEDAAALVRGWTQAAPGTLTAEQFKELGERAKVQAEKNVKNSLLLEKIAAAEKLVVADEEVMEEIKTLAKRNNIPLAQAVDSINREGRREDLKHSLLLRKAIDFLLENAVLY